MKKIYTILVMTALGITSLQSQDKFFLEEQTMEIEDFRSSAWVFPVAHDLELALEDLQAYCKERSDVKLKKDGDNMLIGVKVSIPTIATKRGDLIGKGFITETYYGMGIIFQMGYDISLNSVDWEPEMHNFRNYAKSFMSYHYEKSYSRRMKVVEEEIKGLEKEKDQSQKQIDSMHKKITNLNKKIDKEEDEAKVETYKAEITANESGIEAQTEAVASLKEKIDGLDADLEGIKDESNEVQNNLASL